MTLEQAIRRAVVLGTETGAGRGTIDVYFEIDDLIEDYGDPVEEAYNDAFAAAYRRANPTAKKDGAS